MHPEQPAGRPETSRERSSAGLADALRAGTQALHIEAERTGIIRKILRGQVSRPGYAIYLRNLLPAYRHLEDGLDRVRDRPGMASVACPAVYRAEALVSDLAALCGPDWERRLPLLPVGSLYGELIATASAGDGALLVAHAYTRYMGDLNGGQILKRVMERSLGLAPQCVGFYDFPGIADLDSFKSEYRDSIDAAGASGEAADVIVEEARSAFRHNIAISLAVDAFVNPPTDSTTPG